MSLMSVSGIRTSIDIKQNRIPRQPMLVVVIKAVDVPCSFNPPFSRVWGSWIERDDTHEEVLAAYPCF